MSVQTSYPGVYIDEFAPAPPIQGVGTSTAAFIGVAASGTLREPMKIVVAKNDLPVAFAGGAVVYHRRNVLPRVRWASSAAVINDPKDRVSALALGVSPQTVVLSEPAGNGSPHPGNGS